MKRVKFLKPTHSLPQMPLKGLYFWNAISTPPMGAYLNTSVSTTQRPSTTPVCWQMPHGEKILRKAAEMGYKQFAYLPLFQEDAAKTAEPFHSAE